MNRDKACKTWTLVFAKRFEYIFAGEVGGALSSHIIASRCFAWDSRSESMKFDFDRNRSDSTRSINITRILRQKYRYLETNDTYT